jgi:hypothetical protein
MDKRLAKRHKRQVTRAKEKINLTEPDLRTPEQIEAAREASGAGKGHNSEMKVGNASRSFRNNAATSTGSAAKTDG